MANRIKKANNKGQALVEFALSILVLIVFVFGIFEVGRLFYMKIALANAAREGARYLTRHTDDADPDNPAGQYGKTIQAAIDEAANSGIEIGIDNVTAYCPVKNNQDVCESSKEAQVTVTVDVDVGFVSNLFENMTIEEVAIMRAP